MPEVTVKYPAGFFVLFSDRMFFMRTLMKSTAVNMDAINPVTGVKTNFASDPDANIDLVMIPYDPFDAEVTTPLLATIVTYDWPDRLETIESRVAAIAAEVRRAIPHTLFPVDKEAISFTFLGKKTGAWAVA